MIKHDLDNPDDLGESLLKKRSVFGLKCPYKLFFPSKYSWNKPENERQKTETKIIKDIKIIIFFSLNEKNSFTKIIMYVIVMPLIIKEIFSIELDVKKRPGICAKKYSEKKTIIMFFLRISLGLLKKIKIKDKKRHIYTNICLIKFIISFVVNVFLLKIKRSLIVVEIENQHIV